MPRSYMEIYLQDLTARYDNGLTIHQDNAAGHKPQHDPTRRLSDEEIINQWLSSEGSMLLMENYGSDCERWQEHKENENDDKKKRTDSSSILPAGGEVGVGAPRKPMRRHGSSDSTLSYASADMLLRKPMRRQGSSDSTLSFSFGGENSIVFGPNDLNFHLSSAGGCPSSGGAPRMPLRRKGSSDSTLSLHDLIQKKPMRRQGSSESSMGFGSSSSLGFGGNGSSSSLGGFGSSDSSISLPNPRLHYGLRKHMAQLAAADPTDSFSSSSSSFSSSGSYSSSLSPLVPVQEESALDIKGLDHMRRLRSFEGDESLHLFDSSLRLYEASTKDCPQSQMRMPIRQTSSSSIISNDSNGPIVGPQAA